MLSPLKSHLTCNLSYLGDAPALADLGPRIPSPRERFMAQLAEDRFERSGVAFAREAGAAREAAPARELTPACEAAPASAHDGASAQPGPLELVAQLFQILQALLGLGQQAHRPEAGRGGDGCGPAPGPTSSCAAAPARPDLYARVPEVDGSAAGWQRASQIVEQRTTGTQANREGIHRSGQNPWDNGDGKMPERAAVYWAMQKNADVKYDADQKVFYTTRAGGERDQVVATLDDVMKVMNASGGPSPTNGAAYNAVGAFIDGAVRGSRGGAHGLG